MPKFKRVVKLKLHIELMKLSDIEARSLKILPLSTKKKYTLGRSKISADIILNDESISRNHLIFKVHDHYVTIEDLNTKNGTFLNSRKMKKSILKIGDMIHIGDTVITIKAIEKEYLAEEYTLPEFTLSQVTKSVNQFQYHYT